MRISCCIVCYQNPPDQLERVLGCVAASKVDVALYVIDNSKDDSLAAVAAKFGATYTHLPHNPGFGAAHNVAIRDVMARKVDYHLVLNPDIVFDANVIPVLMDYMDRHPEIGLVMPNVFYPDGRQQYLCKLLPNPLDLLMRRFSPFLYRLSGRLAWYEMHESGYDKIMDVPALSGCFMLTRVALYGQIGSFDERFFMYLEDVDLSRRIGSVARTVYFPYVSVIHDFRKGSYRSLRLLYHHARSAVQYFNKWGWFFDPEKERINQLAMQRLSVVKRVSSDGEMEG
jgi:GT2 family glycosyltransferase